MTASLRTVASFRGGEELGSAQPPLRYEEATG
jgi:hypothetical protein